MSPTVTLMEIVLIGGLWLDSSAWDPVIAALDERGHHARAVRLPGQGAPPGDATLEQQRAAVVDAVDGAATAAGGDEVGHGREVDAAATAAGTDASVMVVGHSAACTLAWMAADARPDAVARVVMIGGFGSTDGNAYADFFEPVDGALPFPGWEPFDGPDSADLDEEQRRAFADAAIPVPVGVAQGLVRYSDERRFGVPVTLVCPEFSPADARRWVEEGQVPELA